MHLSKYLALSDSPTMIIIIYEQNWKGIESQKGCSQVTGTVTSQAQGGGHESQHGELEGLASFPTRWSHRREQSLETPEKTASEAEHKQCLKKQMNDHNLFSIHTHT